MTNPLAADLEQVLDRTADQWQELRGGRLFVTGGTGFFGCWLLESLVWANDRLDLKTRAVVLSRDPERFRVKAPHLVCHPSIEMVQGDVRDFEFPAGGFTHVVHAATEASAQLNATEPLRMLDTIVKGTRRVLEFAVARGASKLLLTSSGAVYGRQPPGVSHLHEDHPGGPDCINPQSAYAEGKRVAELLCTIVGAKGGLEAKIARCFAFVGPYLPLDAHFAMGNFILDGLSGGPIRVKGDGTPLRSYLYASDLAVWLWTVLFRGEPCRPYNVGSEHAISIAELADRVADAFHPRPSVEIAGVAQPGAQPERYIPSTERARLELGLEETVGLDEGLRRTVRWYMRQPWMVLGGASTA